MPSPSLTAPKPGAPRSEVDARRISAFDQRMQIPIVLAALLPLIIAPDSGGWVPALIGIVSWLVFLVDFFVNERGLVRYLSTWMGRFDLAVVVLTAPWFLIPGMGAGQFVVVLRLARLARVVMASEGAQRLVARLGRVGLVAVGVIVVCSAVAYHAEHATNSGFATFGDAMWWGIVTLTTVGYGDIVPRTSMGRWAGVVIMFTGVGVLGILAGSLASFFTPAVKSQGISDVADEAGPVQDQRDSTIERLTDEVVHLRRLVETFLERTSTDPPPSA